MMTPKLQTIVGALLLEICGFTTLALAQTANFGSLTLNHQITSGSLAGTVGGVTSLPAIISNIDRHNHQCLGFGDPNPDHILVLQTDLARLSIRVNSGGAGTTLVIQGPDGVVRCGTGDASHKDAKLVDTDWKAGQYKIWVGSMQPGIRQDYTLLIRP